MYSRKIETQRILGRLTDNPCFALFRDFVCTAASQSILGEQKDSKRDSSLLLVKVVREIHSTTLLVKTSRPV